jgi:HSP20 family molecular chaperone IbpA
MDTTNSNDLNDLFLPLGRNILNSLVGSTGTTTTTRRNSTSTVSSSLRGGRNMFPIDIVNEEQTIYIYAELPGIKKESIDIDIYNNKLTIIANRTKPYEEPEVSEIKSGHMERTLTLPICVTRKETVSVNLNDGILKIKINKLIEEENKFSVKPN